MALNTSAGPQPKIDWSRLTVDIFWLLINHIFSRGSIIVASMVLARSLNTEAFSAFAYFNLTVSMLTTYAILGLGISSSRFFSAYGFRKNPADDRILATVMMLALMASSLGFLMVLVLPANWLASSLDVPKLFLACGVFALTLQAIMGGATLGLEQYRQSALISIFSSWILIGGAFWAGAHGSLYTAMAAYIGASAIQVAALTVLVGQRVGWPLLLTWTRTDRNDVMRVLSFSGPVFATSIVSSSGSWLVGRLLLKGSEGELQFALYAIGLQWFALAMVLPIMVSRVMLPRMVRGAMDQADSDHMRHLTMSGMKLAVGTAIAVACLIIASMPLLLHVYGASHHPSAILLGGFLLAAVAASSANVLGNAIMAIDGQWTWFLLSLSWLVILVCSVICLSFLGAIGASISYALSFSFMTLGAMISAYRSKLI